MAPITATYFNDPACPWGYSFRPAHAHLLWRFGEQVEWRLVVVGLSETTERYARRGVTPESSIASRTTFRRRFGMPFSLEVKTRLSASSRACRAIVAVREQDPELADAALRALQFLNFTGPGLLDDDGDIAAALDELEGVDGAAIAARLEDPAVLDAYEGDRARTRSAEGGATDVQGRASTSDGPVRYTAPSVVFTHTDGRSLEVGGFQPFESYDTALANLEPALARRPAPADPAEALRAFPHGLTTAEVTAVMRPSDLAAEDRRATEGALFTALKDGAVTSVAVGDDALWRAA